MKKLALVIALGAASLLGGTAVNAAENPARPGIAATTNQDAAPSVDVSSRHRHWRRHGHVRHWRHHAWRPYYRTYSYYPDYYAPRYYAPAPVISFGFGGGPRWGHHHRRHW